MTVQYVLNAAVKPGRMGDAVKAAAKWAAAFSRFGGSHRLFSLLPSGEQTGRVVSTTEFSTNAELGVWLDAAMGGDPEIAKLALGTVAEESPFFDIVTYLAQEIPTR
jgi:hypothetical protein